MHMVEQFTFDADGSSFLWEHLVEDTLYFQSPYSNSHVFLRSDIAYESYGCINLSGTNNLR